MTELHVGSPFHGGGAGYVGATTPDKDAVGPATGRKPEDGALLRLENGDKELMAK